MIPRTFPSSLISSERAMTVFPITDTTGLVEWVDYIPVREVAAGSTLRGTYNAGGAMAVQVLASDSGLEAGTDFIRVFIDDTKTVAWTTDANGYIPVEAVDGSFGVFIPTQFQFDSSPTRLSVFNDDRTLLQFATGYGHAKSIHSVTEGKWYFEVDRQEDLWMFGVAAAAESATNYPGQTNNSIGLYRDQIYVNNASVGSYPGIPFTGIVGVKLDMDARTIAFTNGVTTTASIALPFAGAAYVAAGAGTTGALVSYLTLNSGQVAFTHAVPTGYNEGFGPTEALTYSGFASGRTHASLTLSGSNYTVTTNASSGTGQASTRHGKTRTMAAGAVPAFCAELVLGAGYNGDAAAILGVCPSSLALDSDHAVAVTEIIGVGGYVDFAYTIQSGASGTAFPTVPGSVLGIVVQFDYANDRIIAVGFVDGVAIAAPYIWATVGTGTRLELFFSNLAGATGNPDATLITDPALMNHLSAYQGIVAEVKGWSDQGSAV